MKRAVLVVCDGLRADMVTAEYAPGLARRAAEAHAFTNHRSVFPSTTRVTSASIATGCQPGRHGLEGNCVALDEGNGLVAMSAGSLDFRDRLRAATGRTLMVPTLAERLAGDGGAIIFANVSAGAAHFQDPDGFGTLYHRLGSFAPGRVPMDENESMVVSHDGAGDRAMAERFCASLKDHPPPLAVMWLCEPDHSQHGYPLGSPEHRQAITDAEACVDAVAKTIADLRDGGDDVLLLIGSDHGHETIVSEAPLEDLLIAAGFKAGPDSSEVVIASNGFSANIYLSDEARGRMDELVAFLRGEEWVDLIFAGDALAQVGHRTDTALAIAVTTTKSDDANEFGVPGLAITVADPLSNDSRLGCGQHGGLGRYEQHPFLFVDGDPYAPGGRCSAETSAVDLAPTILRHLGKDWDGMDGSPLPAD